MTDINELENSRFWGTNDDVADVIEGAAGAGLDDEVTSVADNFADVDMSIFSNDIPSDARNQVITPIKRRLPRKFDGRFTEIERIFREVNNFEELVVLVKEIDSLAVPEYMKKKIILETNRRLDAGKGGRATSTKTLRNEVCNKVEVKRRGPRMMIKYSNIVDDRDHSIMKENNFWKIPLDAKYTEHKVVPYTFVPKKGLKPGYWTYTTTACRDWVLTMAHRVYYEQMLDKDNSYCVTGNRQARFLFDSTNNTTSITTIKRLVAEAEFYVCSMNATPRPVREDPHLADFLERACVMAKIPLPKEILPFGPCSIKDLDSLEAVSQYFKDDKPIFKALVAYYTPDGIGNVSDLRDGCIKTYEKIKHRLLYYRKHPLVKHANIEPFLDEFPEVVYESIVSYIRRGGNHIKQKQLQGSLNGWARKWDNDLAKALKVPQGSDIVKDMLEILSSDYGDTAKDLTQIAAVLVALHECRSITGAIAVVTLYCTGIPGMVDIMKNNFVDPAVNVLQGDEPTISILDWSWTFAKELGRELWHMLILCFTQIFGEKFLPENWRVLTGFDVSYFSQQVMNQCVKLSIKTVAEYIFTLLSEILDKVKKCVESRSLQPFLNPRMDPSNWKFEVESVITYFPQMIATVSTADSITQLASLRLKGLIPKHIVAPFSNSEMLEYVDNLFRVGIDIHKNFQGTYMGTEIGYTLNKLRSIQSMYSNSFGVMAMRPQPLGIMLVGPPGTGKTNLSNIIVRSLGKRNGFDIGTNSFYNIQIGVNFQDGLTGSHWAYLADDIDQTVASPSAGVPTHVEMVIAMINNAPYPVEQSDVNLKGKVSGRPLVFVQCSNFIEGRLQDFSLNPGAFNRRFPIWAEVTPKAEYAMDSDPMILDRIKVDACTDGEFLNIKVFVLEGLGEKNSFRRPHKFFKDMSRSEFLQFIGTEFRVHLDREIAMLNKRNVDSNTCTICFADLNPDGTGCSCVRQGIGGLVPFVCGVGCFFALVFANSRWKEIKKITTDVITDLQSTMVSVNRTGAQMLEEVARFRLKFEKMLAFIPAVAGLGILILLAKLFLRTAETYIKQGRVDNSVAGFVEPSWTRASQEYTPGLPAFTSTFTYNDIVTQLAKSYVAVKGSFSVRGVCVAHNVVLFPFHATTGVSSVVVRHQGVDYPCTVDSMTMRQISFDLCLLLVQGLAGATVVTSKFWEVQDTAISSFDEVVLLGLDKEYRPTKNKVASMAKYGPVVMCDAPTDFGDCGMVYVARVNQSWRIVGLHVLLAAGLVTTIQATAQICTGQNIRNAVASLGSIPQGISVPLSQTGTKAHIQTFVHYPLKSEYWAAVSMHGFQAHSLGTASIQVHGATIKSQVHPTLFAEDFRDLEEKWCGKPHYFQVPIFKGHMVDGKWVSPFSNSLILKRKEIPNDMLWFCFLDYIHKLHTCLCDGYRELSLEEAIVGVKGSVINGVNLSTSTGMPFNTKKRNHIAVVEGLAYLEPELLKTISEMEEALNGDSIPIPVILGTGKDEPVSEKKNLERQARIFNVLPVATNLMMRKYLGAAGAFMRANPRMTESFVGIDMTSEECNRVIEMLTSVNPELDRLLDADIVKQDKTITGYSMDDSARVFMYMNYLLGMKNPFLAYKLIHGIRNGIFVYKNDFFIIGATNSSGNDKTVEINSIDNALNQRYAYYRMKYPNGLPDPFKRVVLDIQMRFMSDMSCIQSLDPTMFTFKHDVGLGTYGDDAIVAISKDCLFYDTLKIVPLMAEKGMTYTSGNKDTEILFSPLSKLTFLKRSFVWDEVLNRYIAPISLKTLAKMLVMCNKSTLSAVDHGACLLSDVMREAAYHGENFYEEMKGRCDYVSIKYGIDHSKYYQVPLYGVYRERMVLGTFRTWADEARKEQV